MTGKRHLLLPAVLFGGVLVVQAALASSDEDCLACHSDSGLLSSAGQSVFVDQEKLEASIHGQAGLSCLDCHSDLKKVRDFPHAEKLKPVECAQCHEKASEMIQKSVHGRATPEKGEMTVACKDCHGTHEIRPKGDYDSLVFSLNLPRTCEKCHGEKVQAKRGSAFVRLYDQSVHFKALESAGLTLSANCSHCHGAHDIKESKDPSARVSRKNIIQTCGQCHVGILRDYLEGVHGKDYVKGIKDVPVCTDCHSEHDIRSSDDTESRIYTTKVAGLCSNCHDDQALARQYGFLTNRRKTYSQSYHGTASQFGETKVANCASCHGFHSIRDSSDPKSSIHPANLPKTCGKCHPGATKHFAEGKIHFILEETVDTKYRTSHIIKTVYIAFISVIIGVFLVFITADLIHRAVLGKKHE